MGMLLDEVEELEIRLLGTHAAAGDGIEVKRLLAHDGHTPSLPVERCQTLHHACIGLQRHRLTGVEEVVRHGGDRLLSRHSG